MARVEEDACDCCMRIQTMIEDAKSNIRNGLNVEENIIVVDQLLESLTMHREKANEQRRCMHKFINSYCTTHGNISGNNDNIGYYFLYSITYLFNPLNIDKSILNALSDLSVDEFNEDRN